MEDAKQQLVDKLGSANNVLVTVSRDPSVDQLAALLGLTLSLNKMGKHAAAVFSGVVPSTLEFLQPEETIEKTTDSLRDFIIALDKNKADKLRYKVEDDVVKIFITPYRTSITEQDFNFSEGDFNVDVIVALGVQKQEDLDQAITAHGRILHDATVASINIAPDGGLGTITWHDPAASSLSELSSQLVQILGPDLLDEQIATALLTGIVSETDRFRNEKTSAQTMTVSASLMDRGANQQLVVKKLEEAASVPAVAEVTEEAETPPARHDDGAISITHDKKPKAEPVETVEEPDFPPEPEAEKKEEVAEEVADTVGPHIITEPPTLGGVLTSNAQQEAVDPSTDPLSLPDVEPPQLLSRDSPTGQPPAGPGPEPTDAAKTLTELEKEVDSPHINPDSARNEVANAFDPNLAPVEPIKALNAQPLGEDLHPAIEDVKEVKTGSTAPSLEEQIPGFSPTLKSTENTQPPESASTDPSTSDQEKPSGSPNDPPPVPPPIPFQFGKPPEPK